MTAFLVTVKDVETSSGYKELIQGTGVTLTELAGSITIASTGGGVSIADVKADTDIADSLTKKHANTLDHSNSLDHTQNSDTDLNATFEAALKNTDNHTSGSTNKVFTATEQTKLAGIEAGAETNNISDANATDLTDGGATTLHSHAGGGSFQFPVGAIYIEVTGVNPATTFGYGTWSAFGAGRVLVGLDSGDADFDVAEETGGAKTVQSSAQSFVGNASTDIVNHLHTLATGTGASGNFSQVIGTVDTSSGGTGATPTQTALGTRSGNPVSGGVASYTPTGTNTAGAATSVVQPYVVAWFWKRTA